MSKMQTYLAPVIINNHTLAIEIPIESILYALMETFSDKIEEFKQTQKEWLINRFLGQCMVLLPGILNPLDTKMFILWYLQEATNLYLSDLVIKYLEWVR